MNNFLTGFYKQAFIAPAAKLVGGLAMKAVKPLGSAALSAGKTIAKHPMATASTALTGLSVGMDASSAAKASQVGKAAIRDFRAGEFNVGRTF